MNTSKTIINKKGIFIIQLFDIKTEFTNNLQLKNALILAGIPSNEAYSLLIQNIKPIKINKYTQYADEKHKVKEEGVLEKLIPINGKTIGIYELNYFSSACRHKKDKEIGVHTRDAEIFLGLSGFARLEIATEIIEENGRFIVLKDKLITIDVTKNTLLILPKRIQANRWEYIKGDNNKSGFKALYFAYPGPYDRSTVRQAIIQ